MNSLRFNYSVTGFVIIILTMSATVSAKDVDLKNLDVNSLVSRMTPLKDMTPAQWRVVWTGDASREATLSWSTARAGKKHVVHYGTVPVGRGGKHKLHQACHSNGLYTIIQPSSSKEGQASKSIAPAYYHHAKIKDLKPNTRYYFILESDGVRSRELYFVTAPSAGTNSP